MGSVDWDKAIGGDYISIVEGQPKTLVLRNWKPQEQFRDEKTKEVKPGVVFEVYREDNASYDESTKKTWTVTSKRALVLLRPICQKAEAKGLNEIKVSVVTVGKKTDTQYSITELA